MNLRNKLAAWIIIFTMLFGLAVRPDIIMANAGTNTGTNNGVKIKGKNSLLMPLDDGRDVFCLNIDKQTPGPSGYNYNEVGMDVIESRYGKENIECIQDGLNTIYRAYRIALENIEENEDKVDYYKAASMLVYTFIYGTEHIDDANCLSVDVNRYDLNELIKTKFDEEKIKSERIKPYIKCKGISAHDYTFNVDVAICYNKMLNCLKDAKESPEKLIKETDDGLTIGEKYKGLIKIKKGKWENSGDEIKIYYDDGEIKIDLIGCGMTFYDPPATATNMQRVVVFDNKTKEYNKDDKSKPSIKTIADASRTEGIQKEIEITDKDGNAKVSLTDNVDYTDFKAGEYVFRAILMKDGKPVKVKNGKYSTDTDANILESEAKELVLENAGSGTVEVIFPEVKLPKGKYVVYEYAFKKGEATDFDSKINKKDSDGWEDLQAYAKHTDINDDNQTFKVKAKPVIPAKPSIKTIADASRTEGIQKEIEIKDKDGNVKVSLTDNVDYTDFKVGEYVFRAILMKDGKPVKVKNGEYSTDTDANILESEAKELVLENAGSGTVEVIFPEVKLPKGKYVVYEYAFKKGEATDFDSKINKKDSDGWEDLQAYAKHTDINDDNQTFKVKAKPVIPAKPSIKTIADASRTEGIQKEIEIKDKDGNVKVSLTDNVDYTDFKAGEYVFRAILMKDGKPVKVKNGEYSTDTDANILESEAKELVLENAGSGTVEVIFPEVKLPKGKYVVYEYAFKKGEATDFDSKINKKDSDGWEDLQAYAKHTDINDDNQTFKVKEKPVIPAKPSIKTIADASRTEGIQKEIEITDKDGNAKVSLTDNVDYTDFKAGEYVFRAILMKDGKPVKVKNGEYSTDTDANILESEAKELVLENAGSGTVEVIFPEVKLPKGKYVVYEYAFKKGEVTDFDSKINKKDSDGWEDLQAYAKHTDINDDNQTFKVKAKLVSHKKTKDYVAPKTSDDNSIFIWSFLLVNSMLLGFIVVFRKNMLNKKKEK